MFRETEDENSEFMHFQAFKELHIHRMNQTLIHSDFWSPENGNLGEQGKQRLCLDYSFYANMHNFSTIESLDRSSEVQYFKV